MQQDEKKEVWMVQTKRADFNGLSKKLGVSPVSVRIMRNRGMESEEEMRRYLYGTTEELYSPRLMKGMEDAVGLLIKKLHQRKKIRIIGDYDIDGVCSTCLLFTGLRQASLVLLGDTGEIDYEIPDRIKDGYGINVSIIQAAAADGIDTLITCDNGIAASSEIRLAKELGMTVIVTDHHEVPVREDRQELPPADVIVDPRQEGEQYPFREICGAVVAYKLLELLYEHAGVEKEAWQSLLEIAAVATVGDVMRLKDENRLIVKYGLRQMACTKNLGLRMLMEKNGLDPQALSAYHIGFVIGPCLNAGVLLQTAKLALKLLLAEREDEADALAEELKSLNDLRKDMTRQGEEEAVRQVEEQYHGDRVLVLFLPDCHESLAGIIAGRIRERYHRPVFVLTRGEELVKGSGRSIERYHMYQALCKTEDLLPKFGGHPMAAGLSIREEDISEFRRRLNEDCGLEPEDLVPRIWIDVPMPLDYVTESLVGELGALEPFGQGNEKPQFAQKDLIIRSARVLGKNRNVVKLSLLTESGSLMDGLIFSDGDTFLREQAGRERIDIVYYPNIKKL